jgi:hypothetical protein
MIPNILWQTWKTKDIPNFLEVQSKSWERSNSILQRQFMDNEDCLNFIRENFDEDIVKLYQFLPQSIMRADFWRIAVVYINGGYYSDLDITCNLNLSNFLGSDIEVVFIKELDNIANFFFGAISKHPVLKLTLDYMIEEAKNIGDKETQSFGMHSLHRAVREYYNVIETNYPNTDRVKTLDNSELKIKQLFIHSAASLTASNSDGYQSWRSGVYLMNQEREQSHDILFFTTFNKNGYELYGKLWIDSFILVANYYNKFRAKIYYEGFEPEIEHPSITWVEYGQEIPEHTLWKKNYLSKTNHSDYIKTMTVRFSHKAFVIQHVLDNHSEDYLIWLDGDCVFKNSDYTFFPKNLLDNNFLACQVEHNHDLNHVESGILIFDGKHSDKKRFNDDFKKWYDVNHILPMGQPYDGFIVFKTLLTTGLKYTNLNEQYGKGGIQSDPQRTFCHPEIKSKFIHNIGWTGKSQYQSWNEIFQRDDVYQKMQGLLFGHSKSEKIQEARKKLDKLKRMRQ